VGLEGTDLGSEGLDPWLPVDILVPLSSWKISYFFLQIRFFIGRSSCILDPKKSIDISVGFFYLISLDPNSC
jgi:hypothetical protein